MKRLDYDATTEEAVIQYFQTRHYQLSSCGFSWSYQIHNTPLGYFTHFIEGSTKKQYYAFYVLKQHRGKGLLTILKNFNQNPLFTNFKVKF